MRIFSSLTLAALATLYLFARVPAADRRANAASFDERFTFSAHVPAPTTRINVPSKQFDERYYPGIFAGVRARQEQRA